MAMNDVSGMVQANIEKPDDDSLRLDYAGWLEKNDQSELAEFIRAECVLASPQKLTEEERRQLKNRRDQLHREHGSVWAKSILGPNVFSVGFERGFVASVDAKAIAFIKHGATWMADHPIRELTLDCVRGRVERLASCPALARIEKLTIEDERFTAADMAILGNSPNLTGLQALTLKRARIDNRMAMAIAGCVGFRSLTDLSIMRGNIDDFGLIPLLRSPNLVRLQSLYLFENAVYGHAFSDLANAQLPPDLKALSLPFNPVKLFDIEGIKTLIARNPRLMIDLTYCPLLKPHQEDLHRRFDGRLITALTLEPRLHLGNEEPRDGAAARRQHAQLASCLGGEVQGIEDDISERMQTLVQLLGDRTKDLDERQADLDRREQALLKAEGQYRQRDEAPACPEAEPERHHA